MWKSYGKYNKEIKFLHEITVTILELKETKKILGISLCFRAKTTEETETKRSAYKHKASESLSPKLVSLSPHIIRHPFLSTSTLLCPNVFQPLSSVLPLVHSQVTFDTWKSSWILCVRRPTLGV